MPVPTQATRLDRSLARELVYEQLREWIIEGELEPGELVRDQELAKTLGVSRTPVREALRRLEDEGLIETAKHRWTRVAPVRAEQAEDIYGVVKTLEEYALTLAHGRLTETDFCDMEQANLEMAEAVQRRDAAAALRADNALHQVWIGRAGNQELARILLETKHKIRRMELLHFDSSDAALSVAEHHRLVEALRTGDLDRATGILQANWDADIDRFSQRSPDIELSGRLRRT